MKSIVVAGAHSNTGKTTVCREIRDLLDGAVYVKIGTGAEKEDHDVPLFQQGTAFDEVVTRVGLSPFIIIESNSIVSEITPDLLIYLPGTGEEKPSAAPAREKADLVRGSRIECARAGELAGKLGVAKNVFGRILDAAGIKLCSCQFGVF